MAYIFAIDGGGSKTLARLYRADGSLIGESRGGPANLYQNRDRSIRQIMDLWNDLAGDAEPSKTMFTAGLAGLDAPGTIPFLEQNLSAFQGRIIVNDAEAAFLSAFDQQPGCLMIVGTGVAAMRRPAPGAALELLSGWGFPIHDEGGGAWLGAELIRRYLEYLDGYPTPQSPLLRAVDIQIGNSRDTILAWLGSAKPADFASLVPAILSASDPLASALIERAVDKLSALIDCLKPTPTMPLCMAGGLARVIAPRLRQAVGADVMPEHAEIDPLDGLVRMAQQSLAR